MTERTKYHYRVFHELPSGQRPELGQGKTPDEVQKIVTDFMQTYLEAVGEPTSETLPLVVHVVPVPMLEVRDLPA